MLFLNNGTTAAVKEASCNNVMRSFTRKVEETAAPLEDTIGQSEVEGT